MRAGELTRESILERAGLLGLSTALAELPAHLEREGLADRARKASSGYVDDTLAGLVAFVLPGDDHFSEEQGESHPAPGGVSYGTVPLLHEAFDHFGPRAAAGVAVLLNEYAHEVDPKVGPRPLPRAVRAAEASAEGGGAAALRDRSAAVGHRAALRGADTARLRRVHRVLAGGRVCAQPACGDAAGRGLRDVARRRERPAAQERVRPLLAGGRSAVRGGRARGHRHRAAAGGVGDPREWR